MHRHKKVEIERKEPLTLNQELTRIKEHRTHRGIPKRTKKNLLIATWNLTNFGEQERGEEHLRMMAEIIRPFDIVAIQEIADDLGDLIKLLAILNEESNSWDYIFSDTAGNYERLGYLFRKDKVETVGLAAELAMRGYERRRYAIQIGTDEPTGEVFEGFNRNPYMITFKAGKFEFTLVNIHLYWSSFNIRKLETMALASWAKSRADKDYPPNQDIILIGDFNMPQVQKGDEIYNTLVSEGGLKVPKYETEMTGTNLAGDKHYDEVAFFPSKTEEDFSGRMGVFDFDKVVFPDLWPEDKLKEEDYTKWKEMNTQFYQYVRYYLADHRPLWIEFKI